MSEAPNQKTPGEWLAEARRARDLSLEAVATATKIPRRLLRAIEGDEYHKISGPLYVRSFLRAYAEAVGLDAGQVIRLYERHAGREIPVAEPTPVWEEEGATVRSVGLPYGRIARRYLLPALLIVAVAVAGLWLGRHRLGGAGDRSEEADSAQGTRPAGVTALADSAAAGAPRPLASDSLASRNWGAARVDSLFPGTLRPLTAGAAAAETTGAAAVERAESAAAAPDSAAAPERDRPSGETGLPHRARES